MAAAGLLAGWLLFPTPDPTNQADAPGVDAPGVDAPGQDVAAPASDSEPALPPDPPPFARGELPDPPAASAPALLPVRCADLPTGPGAPDSLRLSWRSIRLDDPQVSDAELDRRIRDRARTVSRGPSGWELQLPAQADVLLVLEAGRVVDARSLVWEDEAGRCVERGEALRLVTVEGRVAGIQDGDRVSVFVCGSWVDVDADGRFSARAPAGADCLVFASRQDGMLSAIGGMVDVSLDGGAVLDLLLDLPDYEMAGVGAALTPTEGGVELLQAVPGGAAEAAGLGGGDLVTHVDGEPVNGWDLAEVVAVITGPAGTTVVLTVEDADGNVREVELERSPLDAPSD